jgi:hypothetical protein
MIRRIETDEDLDYFTIVANREIKARIPRQYFKIAKTYGCFDGETLVGGYSIMVDPPFRVLQQSGIVDIDQSILAEITGYFIIDKKFGFKLTMHLLLTVLKTDKILFIYSFDPSNLKLWQYYAKGHPLLLFAGYMDCEGTPWERVEALTKVGILRVFTHRTVRHIKKSVSSLLSRLFN